MLLGSYSEASVFVDTLSLQLLILAIAKVQGSCKTSLRALRLLICEAETLTSAVFGLKMFVYQYMDNNSSLLRIEILHVTGK